MRATDVIGRLGGEEFAAIVPGTAADAGIVAERLRAAFQAAGKVISGIEMGATVSIGVATAVAPVEVDPLLARADAALYRAKHNGRNRIEFDDATAAPAHPAPHTAQAPQAVPAPSVQPMAAPAAA
jgi:diguanylate cyclase (GGDEF)-like protein